jgi:hypothetical protein
MATGFKYNKTLDKWEIINKFDVDDSKYVVSKSKDKDAAWVVIRIGERSEFAYCKEEFNYKGYLECDGVASVNMNKNNLRFILIHRHGYHNAVVKDLHGGLLLREGDLTPFMEIGKCSPLR